MIYRQVERGWRTVMPVAFTPSFFLYCSLYDRGLHVKVAKKPLVGLTHYPLYACMIRKQKEQREAVTGR